MKTNNINQINDLNTEGMLGEIQEIFSSENLTGESLKLFKRNTTRILIIMSKDDNFLKLLNEINCLAVFVSLLKNDLILFGEKFKTDVRNSILGEIAVIEDLLPDFLKLVLTLLKNYDKDLNFKNSSSQSTSRRDTDQSITNISMDSSTMDLMNYDTLINDINFCMIKTLVFFSYHVEIIEQIFKYITSQNVKKNIFEEFLVDYNKKERNYCVINIFSHQNAYYDLLLQSSQ